MSTLALTEVAEAAELYTSALFAAEHDLFMCLIVNVSVGTKMVRIQVKSNGGAALSDTGSFALPGGGAVGDGTYLVPGGGAAGIYCQFTVQGTGSAYRASGILRPGGMTTTSISLPAQ